MISSGPSLRPVLVPVDDELLSPVVGPSNCSRVAIYNPPDTQDLCKCDHGSTASERHLPCKPTLPLLPLNNSAAELTDATRRLHDLKGFASSASRYGHACNSCPAISDLGKSYEPTCL